MNVDKLEKLEIFPNRKEYLKFYLKENFNFLFIYIGMFIYMFDNKVVVLFPIIGYLLFIIIYEYKLDYKLYNILKNRKSKKT